MWSTTVIRETNKISSVPIMVVWENKTKNKIPTKTQTNNSNKKKKSTKNPNTKKTPILTQNQNTSSSNLCKAEKFIHKCILWYAKSPTITEITCSLHII